MLIGKILHTFASSGEASRLGGGRSSPTATGSFSSDGDGRRDVEAARPAVAAAARGGVVIEVRGGRLFDARVAADGGRRLLASGRRHVGRLGGASVLLAASPPAPTL